MRGDALTTHASGIAQLSCERFLVDREYVHPTAGQFS
jgi:hypothetical protein